MLIGVHRDKLARHLAFFSEFTTDIHQTEGRANHVVLSQNIHALQQSVINIDLEALAVPQSSDQELRELCISTTSLRLQRIPLPNTDHSLLCHISQGPSVIRRDIFNDLHRLYPILVSSYLIA